MLKNPGGSEPAQPERVTAAPPDWSLPALPPNATLTAASWNLAIKTIPLSDLETTLRQTLDECADSGETVVVELPDHRLLAIQSLDPSQADDQLVDELLATNPGFRELVARSAASLRKPFVASSGG